jgi:hypothetical protein
VKDQKQIEFFTKQIWEAIADTENPEWGYILWDTLITIANNKPIERDKQLVWFDIKNRCIDLVNFNRAYEKDIRWAKWFSYDVLQKLRVESTHKISLQTNHNNPINEIEYDKVNSNYIVFKSHSWDQYIWVIWYEDWIAIGFYFVKITSNRILATENKFANKVNVILEWSTQASKQLEYMFLNRNLLIDE